MSGPTFPKRRISAVAITALLAGTVLASTTAGVSSAASPQGPTESPSATATERLEAAFTLGFEKSGASGATVGVWVPGQDPYVASKGVADRETGEPMTPAMQAPIGSVTKTYTVLVALQLVREGVLSLDDTIEPWYPTYPEAANITLRMLMNHSSGVSDISEVQIELKCADHEAVLTPDELIELSAGLPREPFAPGQGSSYSSANTILLGRILEKVTATGYEDLLTERLFDPLGLDRTRLDDDGVLEAPFAHGYTDFCAPGLPAGIDTSSWPLIAFSGGALAATIDDLHAYGVAFGEGYGLDDELRSARIDQTAPGDPSSGLGLVVEHDPATGSVVSLGHAGSVMGYGANLVYYPCTGTVFAVMANVDFSPALIDILREVQPVVQDLATGPCAPVTQPTTPPPAVVAVQPITASPRFSRAEVSSQPIENEVKTMNTNTITPTRPATIRPATNPPTCGPGSMGVAQLHIEQQRTLDTARRDYSIAARLLFRSLDLVYSRKRRLLKFRILELIARVPYQAWEQVAYIAITHTHDHLGLVRRIQERVIECREQQDNEQWHLLALEEILHDNPDEQALGWIRRSLIPQIVAFTYYQLSWLLYVVQPAWSYRLNADFEDHAEHEYMELVAEHPEWEEVAWKSRFVDDPGELTSWADLFRQIGHDERMHKQESEQDLVEARFR